MQGFIATSLFCHPARAHSALAFADAGAFGSIAVNRSGDDAVF
jgi:hypothetical protein